MTNDTLWFYGSSEDIEALKLAMSEAGFQEQKGISLDATGGELLRQSIGFVAGVGVGSCIRTYLKTRGKRMIKKVTTTTKDKQVVSLVIRGDFSADEYERFLKTQPHEAYIEDDKNDA